MNLKKQALTLAAILLFSFLPAARAALDNSTEMYVKDDLTVYGLEGNSLDPDVEVKGFTVFGATQAAYTGAVAGPGNVVVNGYLAVSSGAYFAAASTFTNVYATGYSSAAAYYGDGSTLTGVSTHTFKIGDSYGGGKVFWVDAAGRHVLIAATADQGTAIKWGNNNSLIGARSDGVYAGRTNTVMISTSQGPGNYAARLCQDYAVTEDGIYYDDWYLPSKTELQLLYAQRNIVQGFDAVGYWSSTEYELDTAFAWRVSFNDGNPGNYSKTTGIFVRCVRGGPFSAFDYSRDAETVRNGAYVTSTQTFTGANTFKAITASSATITGSAGVYGFTVSSNVSLAGAIYTANGNVGVATATPQGLFQVGAGTFTVLANGNVGVGTLAPAARLDVIEPRSEVSYALRVGTSVSSYSLVVSTMGRVGMGLANNPLSLLHLQANSDEAQLVLIRTDEGKSDGFSLNAGRSRGDTGMVQADDQLLSIGFYGRDNNPDPKSGGFSPAGRIQGYVDGAVSGSGDMPGRLEFLTSPDGTNAPLLRMVIKNDGAVGISTGSPQAALDVMSTGPAAGYTQIWRDSNGNAVASMTATGNFTTLLPVKGDDLGDHNADQNLQMNWHHIQTVSNIISTGNISAAGLDLYHPDVAVSSYTLRIGTDVARYQLVVTTEGWLGLNTADPKGRIHLAGSGNDSGIILEHNSGSGGNIWAEPWITGVRARNGGAVGAGDGLGALLFMGHDGVDGGESGPYSQSSVIRAVVDGSVTDGSVPGRLEFMTASGGDGLRTRLVITSGGTVGISTGNPQAALDVVSKGTADDTSAQIWRNYNGIVVASMTDTGKLYASVVSSTLTAYALNISTGFGPILTVSSSGVNVGSLENSTASFFSVNSVGQNRNPSGEDISLAIQGYAQGFSMDSHDILSGGSLEARLRSGNAAIVGGLRVAAKVDSDASVTNLVGVLVDSFDSEGSAANRYGIFISTLTDSGQQNPSYAIYSQDPQAVGYFAGPVGIGTSTVKGMLSLASTDDDYALDIRQTGGTTPAGIITQKIGGTFASPQAVGDGSKIFALMAAGYNGTEGRVTAGMEGYVDGQVTEGNVPGRLEFLTSPGAGGTVSRMVIKGDGSVGISTGLPQAALDVVATTAVSSAAVQIWRNYSGMAVASVTASGYLLAGGAQIGDMSPIMVDTHSVVSISTRIVNVNGIDEGGGSALAIRAGTRGTTGADMLAGVSIEAGVYNGDDLSKLMPLRLNIRKEGETGGAHVDTAMALFIDEINVSESDSTQIDNTYGIFIDKQKSPDLIQPNVYALYSKDPEARTYFAGDVGIGTAAPSALLEVRDAEATAGYVLLVGTGSSTSLVVTSSGTVGVGTANPSTMTYLNVQARSHNGTAGEDYTSALMSTIYAEGTDSKDGVSGGHFNASVNSDTPLKYLIGVYAALERRNGSGAADLDNAAGIYIDQMKDVGTGAGRINKTVGLYIATQTTTGQLNAPYAIYSEDPEARTFFAGEVGIGTETPRAALDVRGAAEAPEIQIWRGGGGNIVSSMSATGVMAATKFVGDGSGLTSLPSGLAIGDTYGGGVVFWVDAKGKQALIAATGDQSTSIQWAPNSTTVTGAKLNGVYAGKTNTIIISTVHPTGNFAARACADYRLVVNAEYYDDWYLPSIYEMGQLYSQSSNIGGGFTAAYYWSSTELDTAMAYAADFANTGTPTGVVKTNVGRIRCVRAAPSAAIADLPRNAETVTDGAYLSSTQTFTGVNTFKEVTINGGLGIGVVGPQGLLQIGADGLFITSGGAIQTVGKGNGTVYGNSRGNGAVDLQTYRTSGLHVAAGAYSVIAGGQGNAAGSDNAAVGGGKSNIAEGDSSFVGGGSSNTASGTYSFVGGGGPTGAGKPGNKAVSDYSAVVGGSSNTADSNSYMSFIGAGSENRTGAQQVVVAGGWMNRAGAGSNYYSAVVGGWSNTSIGDSSFVGAGGGNLANGAYSAVPGGEYNVASGQKAAVPGGSYNTAKGGYSFAAGRKSSSTADGTFTWADSAGFVVENNVADRTWFKNRGGFLVTASTNTADPGFFVDGAGRVGIATMTPQGMFQVGGGSLTVLANGKVGIGLFSPAATLEVLETNTAENAFIVKAGTSSDNSYLTVSTSGVVAVRGSLVGAKTWQRIRKIELTSFGNDLTFSGLDTTEKEYKLVVRMVYDGSSCSNPGYNELALSANNISGTGYNYITHISSSDNAGASQWVTHTINSGNMILGRYSNVTGHVTMAEGTLLVSSSMAMAQVYQGKCHTYTQTSGYMHRAHEVYATMIPGSDSGPGEIKVKTSPASTNCFGAGSYAELWAFR